MMGASLQSKGIAAGGRIAQYSEQVSNCIHVTQLQGTESIPALADTASETAISQKETVSVSTYDERPTTHSPRVRILFFCHYFPPEVNAPASRTYEHCLRWVQAGHEVTVITCVPNCPDGVVFEGYRNRLRRQIETIDGIRVVRVWSWIAPNAGTFRRICNYLSYMLTASWRSLWEKRPDVIVASSPQFFCGWAGVIASWLRWRPLVLEIRDIWPDSIEAVGAIRNWLPIKILEFLERCMYRSARRIVAVGGGYRDIIVEKVPKVAERTSVITNGVDPAVFPLMPRNEEFLARYKLAGKFVCSYVGTIGMAHGLDVAVESARKLKAAGRKDIAFLLVGDGARRDPLEQMVQDEGLDEWVKFTGRLSREQMPTVLASSDACLVHLRGTELFETVIPSKIFETMAMGRPIIMGVKGPARDIVLQADAGVPMEPGSADELTSVLTKMSDDRAWTASLGGKAREFVLTHYNRDTLAAVYRTLLEEVAGR
jgi:glycosyltransferase involved in cell wall biosynthesis